MHNQKTREELIKVRQEIHKGMVCENCKYFILRPNGGNTSHMERYCKELKQLIPEYFGCVLCRD